MAVKPTVGVLLFPGTNCERETARAVEAVGGAARIVWHTEAKLKDLEAVIVPGGFSYGDYLRSGALARNSPVVDALRKFAASGKPVLGICNGFQILTEAGLLPGALLTNAGLVFAHRWQRLTVKATDRLWWNAPTGEVRMPIAHHQGCFYLSEAEYAKVASQVLFEYTLISAADPDLMESGTPNGSLYGIAGIRNAKGNVLGMMPHPERAMRAGYANGHGRTLFESLLAALKAQ